MTKHSKGIITRRDREAIAVEILYGSGGRGRWMGCSFVTQWLATTQRDVEVNRRSYPNTLSCTQNKTLKFNRPWLSSGKLNAEELQIFCHCLMSHGLNNSFQVKAQSSLKSNYLASKNLEPPCREYMLSNSAIIHIEKTINHPGFSILVSVQGFLLTIASLGTETNSD